MPPFVLYLVFISYAHILLYVAKQNFKISTSEYLRCASKCAISRLNNQTFSGEGHSPLPRPLLRRGGGHLLPAPHPLGAFGASPPRRLDTPPKLKSCLRHCRLMGLVPSKLVHYVTLSWERVRNNLPTDSFFCHRRRCNTSVAVKCVFSSAYFHPNGFAKESAGPHRISLVH